jgi:ATP-dependent helicase HrpA
MPQARAHPGACADITRQLEELMPAGWIGTTPAAQLGHLPRYLKGIGLRIEKLRADPDRDARLLADVAALQAPWRRALAQRRGQPDPRLEEFRWLLEELRVSLFAQELRTPMPVSIKRLQKAWQAIVATG